MSAAAMIAKLTRPRRFHAGDGRACIDVNGVGYLVFCSARTLAPAAGQGRAGLAC